VAIDLEGGCAEEADIEKASLKPRWQLGAR
jgi:hypothetical protein